MLFSCASPCLVFSNAKYWFYPLTFSELPVRFLRCGLFLAGFAVRCAAYAAWTTPGLAKTEKTFVKLTCLCQVQVSSQSRITRAGQ